MKSIRIPFFLLALMLISGISFGQDNQKVVQLSGQIYGVENGDTTVLIYTNVAVKGTSRGTVSDIDGFFSIPVKEEETIQFSRIGYVLKEVLVPTGIDNNFYSLDVTLEKDTLFLPETVIMPWPDKDFFEIEFLALEVDSYLDRLETLADQNLAPEKIAFLRQVLPVDGGEVSKIELQQVQQAYYYYGQIRPQNIFNPLSWKKFIDAIRNGDYKKK